MVPQGPQEALSAGKLEEDGVSLKLHFSHVSIKGPAPTYVERHTAHRKIEVWSHPGYPGYRRVHTFSRKTRHGASPLCPMHMVVTVMLTWNYTGSEQTSKVGWVLPVGPTHALRE